MLRVIEHACDAAIDMEADSPFELWQDLADAQSQWGTENQIAPLLYGFGTSMVERALIEAYCRALGKPFSKALIDNDFGISLGAMQIETGDTQPVDWLPHTPLPSIIARHTIGLADPWTAADIPAD